MDKWIPISERLPEEDGLYFVYTEEQPFVCPFEDGVFFIDDVLAWMHLPRTIQRNERMKKGVTVGEILDLIDCNRDSEEYVRIKDCNGQIESRVMIKSDMWDSIEDRFVNSMGAEEDEVTLWLEDKEKE